MNAFPKQADFEKLSDAELDTERCIASEGSIRYGQVKGEIQRRAPVQKRRIAVVTVTASIVTILGAVVKWWPYLHGWLARK